MKAMFFKNRGLQGAEPSPQMNVKMQITFTFSVEDFDLLVALVTASYGDSAVTPAVTT